MRIGTAGLFVSAAFALWPSTRLLAGEAPLRHVTLLHIADTHAQLETHPEYMPGETGLPLMGGYARIKTAVDRERASAPAATFFADGGDTFQGTAAAAWSRGEAVVAPLNALGLDVCVPGNWEVVYGPAQLKHLTGELSCRVLAYNFHDTATGQRLFAASTIIERGGVRVAFVGITDPTTSLRQPPDEVAGLDTTRMGGLREYVRALHEKADLVVAVTHTGLTISRQLARDIPEFDVILSGHTHERTQQAILEGKVIVVEPGSMGSFLGRLDLTLGPGGVTEHRFRLIPLRASEFAEDPMVKQKIDTSLAPYRARMAGLVGKSETPILRYDVLETSADDFIADAVRAETHADIAATNGFRFAPPIPAGALTEGEMWLLLPLDARVKMGWVTGAELRAYLENELELVFSRNPQKLSGGWGPRLSGVSMRFQAGAPAGHRLRELMVGGKKLDDAQHYTFAGCERAGEPLDVVCRLRGVHDVKVTAQSIHALLDGYLAKHPEVAPVRDGRAVATDLPARVFSQDAVIARLYGQNGDATAVRP